MEFLYICIGGLGLFLWFGKPIIEWWDARELREQEVAELEAAELHTRPVLIRSRYIGDPDVEDAAYRLRENIRRAGKGCFISSEDVHIAIYRTRSREGDAFIDFQDWVDLVEYQHRKLVMAWEADKETEMKTDKGRVGLTDAGQRILNGQKKPKKRTFVFDFSKK